MTCATCEDRGFVHRVGPLKSPTGVVTKDVDQVVRCPEYVKYFQHLQLELGLAVMEKSFDGDTVSAHVKLVETDEWKRLTAYATKPTIPGGCGAAVRAHLNVRDRVAEKHSAKVEEGKPQRRGWFK